VILRRAPRVSRVIRARRGVVRELLTTVIVHSTGRSSTMTSLTWKAAASAALVLTLTAVPARAQSSASPSSPWSAEVAVGWDNGIAGHINSSGIGTLNNQTVVVKANTFEDVYGTGLHLRGGIGYMLSDITEITGNFTWQSLDADQVVAMGDIGVSNLYGQYSDYQTVGLDVGLRRYLGLTPVIKAYGEGTMGIGFIDKTDIQLVAPTANVIRNADDLYDQSAAWAAGANVGVMVGSGKLGVFGQLGLRYMSGMADVDDLEGTGLETINDKSSRWTLPFVGGVRVRF
jgi:hypothetical protein